MKAERSRKKQRESSMLAVSMITIVVAVTVLVLMFMALFSHLGLIRLPESMTNLFGLFSSSHVTRQEEQALIYQALESGKAPQGTTAVLTPDEGEADRVLSRFDTAAESTLRAEIFSVNTVLGESGEVIGRSKEKFCTTVVYCSGGRFRVEVYKTGGNGIESVCEVAIVETEPVLRGEWCDLTTGERRSYSGDSMAEMPYQCRPLVIEHLLEVDPYAEQQRQFLRMKEDNVLFLIQRHRGVSEWEERFYVSVETGMITEAAAYFGGELRYGIDHISVQSGVEGFSGEKDKMFTDLFA